MDNKKDEKYLRLIPGKPLEFFKSIRMRKYFYSDDLNAEKSIGFLNYIRKTYTGYDPIKGDEFDSEILSKMSAVSEECFLYINQPLIYENHQEHLLAQTVGNRIQDAKIILIPTMTEEYAFSHIGDEYVTISFNLKINARLIGVQREVMKTLTPEFLSLSVAHDRVHQLAYTVSII